jgi:cytochrome bd ubiquinol oxidase subunit I
MRCDGLDPIILSRSEFALLIGFHIIPAFTVGLAAWLATVEGASLSRESCSKQPF